MAHNNIQEQLDKGVANSGWKEVFSNFTFKHCVHSVSDHCPLLLDSCRRDVQQIQRVCHFKFEATWLLEESCEGKVRHLWNS